jgi:ubiquinone/menaquinone biosynthesis C-methylase UbiE
MPDENSSTDPSGSLIPGRYDAAHAAAWNKWFHIIESGAQRLCDRMVELAEIAPGQNVLDVATGLGEPAVTAAAQVGAKGRVLAIDTSADMLEFAKARATKLGLDQVDFQVMDAQAPNLPEAGFDAVLCRWGLMFMTDLDGVLAALRRTLAPGGHLVAAIWGAPEDVPAISLSNRLVHASLGLPPLEEGAKTPFALSDVAVFLRRIEAAGFDQVRGEWVTVTYSFESAEAFTAFRRERSGALNLRIAHLPADQRESAWQAVCEAARARAAPDGTLRLANAAYCASARR